MDNTYKIVDGVAYVDLIRKGQPITMLIDEQDLPLLEPYSRVHVMMNNRKKNFYAVVGGAVNKKLVHRIVMGFPKLLVDHINRNGLDNRRANLREATISLNSANMGEPNKDNYRGVYWNKNRGKWMVRFSRDKKQYYYGLYKDKDKALEVAIKAFKELWPEL